jgi:hypothetical protein
VIEWCDKDPEARYPAMAGAVSFIKGSEEEDVASYWSSVALKLIERAPDPLAVLHTFVGRFRPSGWSGSLASILEGRKALLDKLAHHANEDVVACAGEESIRLAAEIDAERKWEAERDRNRDERFE